MDGIIDATALRTHYGTISPLAEKKVLPTFDRYARDFIALSPFLVLATTDGRGKAAASPRGDAPGFVLVLNEAQLLLPDRPGNNRVDSFGNIVAHPGVGLIFLVPGIDETLRMNGRARVVTEASLLAPTEAQGKVPKAGLLIEVEEVFFHCGKALKRAKLWDAARHVERSQFPTLGRIIADQTGACDADTADARIEDAYRTKLY